MFNGFFCTAYIYVQFTYPFSSAFMFQQFAFLHKLEFQRVHYNCRVLVCSVKIPKQSTDHYQLLLTFTNMGKNVAMT